MSYKILSFLVFLLASAHHLLPSHVASSTDGLVHLIYSWTEGEIKQTLKKADGDNEQPVSYRSLTQPNCPKYDLTRQNSYQECFQVIILVRKIPKPQTNPLLLLFCVFLNCNPRNWEEKRGTVYTFLQKWRTIG